MKLNKRWFSSNGFFIEIQPDINTVNGKFFLPSAQTSIAYNWSGILIHGEECSDIAFIIHWKTKKSKSYTTFSGNINKEGKLFLDWLLFSEDLLSHKITSIQGTSILSSVGAGLISEKLELQPFPLELSNSSSSAELFKLSELSVPQNPSLYA